jgi:hypothetical protein
VKTEMMLLTKIKSRANEDTIQANLTELDAVESVVSIHRPLHLTKSKVQFLQFIVVTFILLISPDFTLAQLPDLGTAENFVLFSSAGALGNVGTSVITGDIGTNDGAITGFGTPTMVNGSIESENSVTAQCSIDVQAAYNELLGTPATVTNHAPVFGGGETLSAGVYSIAAAGSLGGSLTLNAEDDADAVFIFKFGGAFTTTASSVILSNGATACNVFWIAEGAIAMAASTDIKGTIIANNGAISLGADGILEGRMLTTAGAATLLTVSIALPSCEAPGATADAGLSTDIVCFNTDYTASATATNGTILWTTSGDGMFGDAMIEDAVYTFGETDSSTGAVTLTMTVTGILNIAVDNIGLLNDPFCPIPPCTEVIDLNAAYFAHDPHQNDFHAGMKVIADGIITSSNMEAITFRAGTEVELRPVFEVQQGALLTINIEPCVIPTNFSK